MPNLLSQPSNWVGDLRTNTHLTAGMVVKQVGQTGIEVTIAGADGATACTGYGVVLASVTGGRAARIATDGRVPVIAGAAFSRGDSLMVIDAGGRVGPIADAGVIIVAVAEEAAVAAGVVVMARVLRTGTKV